MPEENSFTPWVHPTGNKPQVVNIVACGPTIRSYHSAHFSYDPIIPTVDETWGVNKGLRTQLSSTGTNLGFIMDDMAGEADKSERYRAEVDSFNFPIITSIIDDTVASKYYERFAGSRRGLTHAYPISEVIERIGVIIALQRGATTQQILSDVEHIAVTGEINGYYLHNSIPLMLAYALFIGVKKVHLFGCDYTFPGADIREDDRANCEYWVGFLRANGVEVWTTQDTTLLNQNKQPFIYGYGARPPRIRKPTRESLDWHLSQLGLETL